MDRTQDPLLQQLQTPPLRHKGFTDELRLRIEQDIDKLERKKRSRFSPIRWVFMGGGTVAAVLLAIMIMRLPGSTDLPPNHNEQAAIQASGMTVIEERNIAPIRSGLLLGLRDNKNEYRTIWIAPQEDRLALKAEGRGLLIPYKLDFWLVETVPGTIDEASKRIAARIAEADPTERPVLYTNDSQPIVSASIEFVGQQYVAMQLATASSRSSMVTTLTDLAKGRANPVSLHRLTNDQSEEGVIDWTIKRESEQWRVHIDGVGARADLALTKGVVTHDGKCLNWQEITAFEPGATDAVCSPGHDMIAVFFAEDIRIYPYDEGIIEERRLTVPLKEEETLVMAEWATDDYVNKWNDSTAKLLR